jgi:S1-C subfamily serine protease
MRSRPLTLLALLGLSLVLSGVGAAARPPDEVKLEPPPKEEREPQTTPGMIPPKTLKAIKAATVFIKAEFTGPGLAQSLSGTGTGFLLLRGGDTGYVVTNHHVVNPAPVPVRVGPAGRPGLLNLTRTGPPLLVFHSGTAREKAVPATVVASDPGRDLAILRVMGFKDLPRPIPLDPKIEVGETMSIFCFGFPFGGKLGLKGRHPNITVGKASVSSLREDETGKVRVIQIQGDLNPGNSGGPVVDDRGRLVGIAVAKVAGTQIGMAIPAGELFEVLRGQVGRLHFHMTRTPGGATIRVEAELVDPLRKLKEVTVYYLPPGRSAEKIQRDKDGRWPALAGAVRVQLKLVHDRGTGEFTVTAKDSGPIAVPFQAAYLNAEGRAIYNAPSVLSINPPGKPPSITPFGR